MRNLEEALQLIVQAETAVKTANQLRQNALSQIWIWLKPLLIKHNEAVTALYGELGLDAEDAYSEKFGELSTISLKSVQLWTNGGCVSITTRNSYHEETTLSLPASYITGDFDKLLNDYLVKFKEVHLAQQKIVDEENLKLKFEVFEELKTELFPTK